MVEAAREVVEKRKEEEDTVLDYVAYLIFRLHRAISTAKGKVSAIGQEHVLEAQFDGDAPSAASIAELEV